MENRQTLLKLSRDACSRPRGSRSNFPDLELFKARPRAEGLPAFTRVELRFESEDPPYLHPTPALQEGRFCFLRKSPAYSKLPNSPK